MQTGLVTVVIPIYNAEAELDRCVLSILGQTYPNLEIVLVDDGSTDGSPRICDAWKEKDSRIKVIHKENAGAGMARNSGIEIAEGEYICFCDSDDSFRPDTVEACYKTALDENADIVYFGVYLPDSKAEIKPKDKKIYCEEKIRTEFIPEMIGADPRSGGDANYYLRISNCMISMSLISKIHWRCASEREVYSEDIISLTELFGHVTCAVTLDKALYCYCRNEKSMTHTLWKDEFKIIKEYYRVCSTLCSKMNYTSEIRIRLIEHFLNFTIATTKKLSACNKTFSEKKQLLSDIISDEILQKVLFDTRDYKRGNKKKLLFFLWRKKYAVLSYFLLRRKAEKSR